MNILIPEVFNSGFSNELVLILIHTQKLHLHPGNILLNDLEGKKFCYITSLTKGRKEIPSHLWYHNSRVINFKKLQKCPSSFRVGVTQVEDVFHTLYNDNTYKVIEIPVYQLAVEKMGLGIIVGPINMYHKHMYLFQSDCNKLINNLPPTCTYNK